MTIPKLRTTALAAVLMAGAVVSLPNSAQARWGGWRGGWGWGGVGLGLAAGAIIGSALAAPYYAPPYYDYGGYGYGYGGYGYSGGYDYGYSPAFYSYGYSPLYSYYGGGPSWGVRQVGVRPFGFRRFHRWHRR